MAIESDVNASDHVFVGEDKTLSYTIYDADGVTPIDVALWAMVWILRKTHAAADPAILTKATGGLGVTVTGTYNADPELNTQRVQVTIADTDTEALSERTEAYAYSLKRTDDGTETILSFGKFYLRKTTAR